LFFQTFDDKEKCICVYTENNLFFDKFPKNLTTTWSYSEFLKDKDVEYAKLYCNNKTLNEVCPDHLREPWERVNKKIEAFYRSAAEVKLDLNEHCFFNLVPRKFLKDYGEIKNRISQHVINNYKRPENYDFLLSLTKVLTEIKNRKLNIDTSEINNQLFKFKTRKFIQRVNSKPHYITYDAFGTKTGRLSTKNSFPILTMDKDHRKILKPNNDWFIEFDYNAAELRVLLGLLGKEQPQEDIHEWNLKNVYKNIGIRDQIKKRIFAWLYNPNSKDHLSNKAYDRKAVVEKYYNGTQVTTFFNRVIPADEHHALNYIIQSTAADLFLRQMIKVWKLLKNKKSYIAFCLHDSLIIDFSEQDMKVLVNLKKEFANTELGNFLVNVSAGENFGNMKKLNI